ncbi:interferon-activable protein 202-like [Arvicanthis niloticus]|uniref:interferon-activable protein 202-like n=1 Tax=Arvicanthis niloticus TaxID=61156 RepID=UPI00403C6BA1
MFNLNLRASTSTDLAEGQHQTPPRHLSGLVEDQIQASPGPNQKAQTPKQNMTRGAVLQKETLTVMMLKETDLFEYELSEQKGKNMFHATVATVCQYFHVKIFKIDLKEKFTKKNFITISNYFESNSILEISEASSLSEAAPDQKIEVPNNLIRNAKETPKICDIQNGASGALFYGLFTLHNVMCKNLFLSFLHQNLETNMIVFHLVFNDSIATKHSILAGGKI